MDRSYNGDGAMAGMVLHYGGDPITVDLLWDPTREVPQILDSYVEEDLWTRLAYGNERIAFQFFAEDEQAAYGHYPYDHRGSAIPNGYNLVASDGYDPYGTPNTDLGALMGEYFTPGYRGEFHIDSLIHLRNRDYDPATGTFTTPDPLDSVDGTPTVANAYHYADNDPLNRTDPLGLRSTDQDLVCGDNSFQQNTANYAAGILRGISPSELPVYGPAALPFVGGQQYIDNPISGEDVLRWTGNENNYCHSSTATLLGETVGAASVLIGAGYVQFAPGSTAARLSELATQALRSVGPGSGPVYGTRVHTAFARLVRSSGRADLHTEVSYLQGRVAPYGARGSVRLDVVQGTREAPIAVYDLKTGSARLTPGRVEQIRSHLPQGSQDIPVIEIRGQP